MFLFRCPCDANFCNEQVFWIIHGELVMLPGAIGGEIALFGLATTGSYNVLYHPLMIITLWPLYIINILVGGAIFVSLLVGIRYMLEALWKAEWCMYAFETKMCCYRMCCQTSREGLPMVPQKENVGQGQRHGHGQAQKEGQKSTASAESSTIVAVVQREGDNMNS
jgi:hypothetical protein